jgi:hypothetical protein
MFMQANRICIMYLQMKQRIRAQKVSLWFSFSSLTGLVKVSAQYSGLQQTPLQAEQ